MFKLNKYALTLSDLRILLHLQRERASEIESDRARVEGSKKMKLTRSARSFETLLIPPNNSIDFLEVD